MKRQESTNSNNAFSIYASIICFPCHFNLNESRLPKKTLTQAFKCIRLHCLNDGKQPVFPINIFEFARYINMVNLTTVAHHIAVQRLD